MSKTVGRNFSGIGIDLSDWDIENERPTNHYLDEDLTDSTFTCLSAEGGKLYFGIEWGNIDKSWDDATIKRMIAERITSYLEDEDKKVRAEYAADKEHNEEILENPLSKRELLGRYGNEDDVITVRVAIPFNRIVDNDLEGLMDLLNDAIIDNGLLQDINYTPVGVDNGFIIIEVSARFLEDDEDRIPSIEEIGKDIRKIEDSWVELW